jgi:hypothetical protein
MSKHPPQPTWTGKDKPKKDKDTPDLPIDGYINYGLLVGVIIAFILIKKNKHVLCNSRKCF